MSSNDEMNEKSWGRQNLRVNQTTVLESVPDILFIKIVKEKT